MEDLDIADEINNFFANVATDLQPLQPIKTFNLNLCSRLRNYAGGSRNAVSSHQGEQSPWSDGIPNWILRDIVPFICGPLCAIFNASVCEGFVPPIWKHADTIPAPKVNPPKSLQSDLRPISLTPTLASCLSRLLANGY